MLDRLLFSTREEPLLLGKLLERYQMHSEEEIGASNNAGGTDKKHNSECSDLRAGANRSPKMIQSGREAQDLDNLDVPELTQLEEELDALLRQTRSRKLGLCRRSVMFEMSVLLCYVLSLSFEVDTADDGNPYSSYRDGHIHVIHMRISGHVYCEMPSLELMVLAGTCIFVEKQLKEEKRLIENESLDGFNLTDCSTEAEGASRARTELATRNRIGRALPPLITLSSSPGCETNSPCRAG
ncbi:hypothetical protein C1H46_007882 [Malus baccata]|uniref:K-box domain-containing protein n=1 Tax=Malus baccata TaxID=106549 RepID=A0A540N638_MALBA|nr:hypothetical protein C1H46_007882 [Malus baccata]